MSYPVDRAGRQDERDRLLLRELRFALTAARRGGCSLRCQAGDHRQPSSTGCANDGTGCLCVCHDDQERTP